MSHEAPYSRELSDIKFQGIHTRLDTQDKRTEEQFVVIKEALDTVLKEQKKTNGNIKRHDKIFLVVGTAVGVLLLTNGSELIGFLLKII